MFFHFFKCFFVTYDGGIASFPGLCVSILDGKGLETMMQVHNIYPIQGSGW